MTGYVSMPDEKYNKIMRVLEGVMTTEDIADLVMGCIPHGEIKFASARPEYIIVTRLSSFSVYKNSEIAVGKYAYKPYAEIESAAEAYKLCDLLNDVKPNPRPT